MNEVAKVEQNQIEIVQKETLTKWLSVVGNKLEKNEQALFLEIAQAFNLNPFKREIYCVAYGEGEKRQLSIITGYEVYLKRAENSGMLDGWKVWTEGEVVSKVVKKTMNKKGGGTWEKDITVWSGEMKAVIEISRKDRAKPFIHEVDFSEYCQINEMWGSKPKTMIKKVVMAQGFRLCFPIEVGGMPYTEDEMPSGENINIEVAEVVKETKPEQPPQKTAKQVRDEKIRNLPAIAEQNGITNIADFAVFAGWNKDNPERKTAIDVFVSEPSIYLDTIRRYKETNELQITDKSDNDLPF